MKTIVHVLTYVAALACMAVAPPALAQSDSRPVRLIVPVLGGTIDLLARLVAPGLSQSLGRPVIVENKPGAGGTIGADFVAKAPADGLTVLVSANGPLSISVSLMDNLPYDPVNDLAPITLGVRLAQLFVVNPSVPVSNVADFLAYAKQHRGKLSYASISPGSVSHLTMERLKFASGLEILHVPYKGAGPAVNDLLANVVQAGFFVTANVLPHVKSGRLKVLASTGRTRAPTAPGVPTLIEAGLEDFEATGWIGFLTTAGTPKRVVEQYQREIARILRSPDLQDRFAGLDFEVVGSSSEEFDRVIRSEIRSWGSVIKQLGPELSR